MTTETKKTALELYTEFVTEFGTDISKMDSDKAEKFAKLLTAKSREEKKSAPKEGKRDAKVASERPEYEQICSELGLTPSDKFAGFEMSKKPGAKDKDGNATIAQYVVGIKAYEGDTMVKVISNISPDNFTAENITKAKNLAVRLLSAL